MHVRDGSFRVECAADGKNDVGNAFGDDCGQCAVCEYYAFWHVPEHGKPCGRGGNCCRNGSTDSHALYARAGGALGAGSPSGISRGEAGNQ